MTLIIKLQDDFVVNIPDVVKVEWGREDSYLGKTLHYVKSNGNGGGFKTNRVKDFEVK